MIITNGEVVTPGGVVSADIQVADGRIAAIGTGLRHSGQVVDASDCFVIPGLVDPHIHVDADPTTPLVEDLVSCAGPALRGGITTVFSYLRSHEGVPLPQNIREQIELGRRAGGLDFGFHARILPGENIPAMVAECARLGVTSFKGMMAYHTRGTMLDDDQLLELMTEVAATGGLVIVHAENGRATAYLDRRERNRHSTDADAYLRTQPGLLEAEGMYRAATLARIAGVPLLFAHLSAAQSVALQTWLLDSRWPSPLAWETQPHFLMLTNQSVRERGALAKIGPPLKGEDDVLAVQRAFDAGLISHLSTDHSPRTVAMKTGKGILDAPHGGISGVELLLPLTHHLIFDRSSGLGIEDLVRMTSTSAARILGIYPRKGAIAIGSDADLVLLPKTGDRRPVRCEDLHGGADYSLYEGATSCGFPRAVIRAGVLVVAGDEIVDEPPSGRYLARGDTAGQERA